MRFEFGQDAVEMRDSAVLSVGELTRCIRGVLEAEDLFRDVWVRGEVSNLVKHSSGHIYFSLKDESALIRCVIWKGNGGRARFDLADGMGIIIRGRVTVYEKQGQYQVVVNEVAPDGIGALYVALEQLKARLSAEGLFSPERKSPLPAFPEKIAIVTSPTAAALSDMVSVARRRMPCINLLLAPALMQGGDSESSVSESLRIADSLPDIDVIVLGRGGGSIEDLWTFNSEQVVRAIAACRTPVVSAIGHETDFTLADMAADLRAPTPSAAMELVAPDRQELLRRIRALVDDSRVSLEAAVARRLSNLDVLLSAPCMRYPTRMLEGRAQSLDLLRERLDNSARRAITDAEKRVGELAARLDSLSPLAVLGRGYAIMRRSHDGSLVRRKDDVGVGDSTYTLVSDGRIVSKVVEIREGWT